MSFEHGWEPPSFAVAFPFAVVTCVCWGSWSNAAKAADDKKIPFGAFYGAYAVGCFLFAILAFVTLGNWRFFYCGDIYGKHAIKALAGAVFAGFVFNLANILLILAIQIAGLVVAFPIGIGLALVLGTVLTYIVDSSGNPILLFSGVLLGLLAVLVSTVGQKIRDAHTKTIAQDNSSEDGHPSGFAPLPDIEASPEHLQSPGTLGQFWNRHKSMLLCGLCGVLMSCWSPLNAMAVADPDKSCSDNEGLLTAYSSFVLFTGAVVVSTPPIAVLLLHYPLNGDKPQTLPAALASLPWHAHLYGLAGGAIWAVGTLSNSIAGSKLGFALSYAVGQAAPMVATLWGLLYYREFDGAPVLSFVALGFMFVLYAGAIALIALSK